MNDIIHIRIETIAERAGRLLVGGVARHLLDGLPITPSRVSALQKVAERFANSGELYWGVGRSPVLLLTEKYATEVAAMTGYRYATHSPDADYDADALTAIADEWARALASLCIDTRAAVAAVSVEAAEAAEAAVCEELIVCVSGFDALYREACERGGVAGE